MLAASSSCLSVADVEPPPCPQKVTFLEGGPGILAVKTAILSTLGDRGSALAAQQVTALLCLAVRLLGYCLSPSANIGQLVTSGVPPVRQASVAPSAAAHPELHPVG